MELNREQVKKALECCSSGSVGCLSCPVDKQLKDDCTCGSYVMGEALRYIKELERKNRALEADNNRLSDELLEISDYAVEKIREAKEKALKEVIELILDKMENK